MQTDTQHLGMTTQEASDFMVGMAGDARSLGMDVSQMASQFDGATDFLARFGKEGSEVFRDLAVQAKSLGMDCLLYTSPSPRD